MESVVVFIFSIAIFVYSVVLHEIAHGYVALQLGDPTAKAEGRLTLNPVAHVDLIWTILMPLMFILADMSPLGGAKPVPVNTFNFLDRRRGILLTSAAGPATNAALAIALALLLVFTLSVRYLVSGPDSGLSLGDKILASGIATNLGLTIFNLIPIPPLDGSRILACLAPELFADLMARLEEFGFLILILILNVFPGSGHLLGLAISVLLNHLCGASLWLAEILTRPFV